MSKIETTARGIAIDRLLERCSEDPNREPHEKETALHLTGDGTHFDATSFKRVVYTKWLPHLEYDIECLHVLDQSGNERTASVVEVIHSKSLTVIGASARIPVGAVSIGKPRKSNTQAEIVK